MSTAVGLPVAVLSLGTVGVPPADIKEAFVHLGCSKEVSSFEVILHNWNGKYSPNGTYPILVGVTGGLGLCRAPNNPANSSLISVKVESVKYETDPTDSLVRVSGRCWGEWLFRRVITKTYENVKGEEIIKDLIDSFTDLGHVRGSTELIVDTDTTYTRLEYEDTPLWDIIKYIAETSDKAGIIGFDFRVAPDGLFEFFPKNSKTNLVNLTDKIEAIEYRKDISRVRNRIKIYGEATKSVPLDKDGLTEILNSPYGDWTCSSPVGVVAQDSTTAIRGLSSIKCHVDNGTGAVLQFTFKDGQEVNTNLYPFLFFFVCVQKVWSNNGAVVLEDINGKYVQKPYSISPDDEWKDCKIGVGAENTGEWNIVQEGFDWTKIKKIRIGRLFPNGSGGFPVKGWGDFWIDGLYFGGCRYSSTQENSASATAFGLRELVEVEEELWSDNECELRAKALLAYLKDSAEYIVIKSTVIDYGTSPILAGDKVHVTLPNEGVDADFRAEYCEYHYIADTQTLEITLDLGKEPPQVADYLYGLRTFTVNVEKLSRTKRGNKGFVASSAGVGGGGGGGGYNGVGLLEVRSACPEFDWATLEPYLWGFNELGEWTPDSLTLPLGESVFRFKDETTSNWLEMGLFFTTTDSSPVLWISQHLTVKKDFACGGMLTSFQGALFLGSGLEAESDMPQIVLAHSEAAYGGRDTLEVWRAGKPGLAKLKCDTLLVDKIKKIDGTVFNYFLIPDQYGYVTISGIHFGEGWGDFYRSTVEGDKVVELSGLGLVLHGYLNAKSISLNPPAGTPALASNSSAIVCTGINADLLDGYHASDFLRSIAVLALSNMPQGVSGFVLTGQGLGSWPQYTDVNSLISSISADSIDRGGITNSITVATPGGGTVTLHFVNSKFAGSS